MIIFLIPVGLASAEEGSNYIREQNPDGTATLRLISYDRILVDGQWLNYNFYQDANSISFESASSSFKLDKSSCDFALYEKGQIAKAPIIENYKTEYLKDDVKILGACLISPILEGSRIVSFNTTLNGITRVFHLSTEGVEWTNLYDNNEGKDINFKIHETCEGCTPDRVEGDELFFGDYKLDLKNEQHGTLSAVTNDKGNYLIEYEAIVKDKERIIIDPTFTSSNPTEDAQVMDTDNDDNCEAVPGSVGFDNVAMEVGRYNAAFTEDCTRAYAEFDISSLPSSAQILDSDFTFEITFITNPTTCDYVGMTGQPTAQTDAQNWASIGSGTALSSADATCATTGISKNVDLTSAGDTYIQSQIASGWAAIGLKRTGDVGAIDATTRYVIFCHEEAACTPDPTLTLTYTQIDDITDLTSTDIRSTGVDVDWSQPTLNGGEIQGYQINSTTPWSNNVASIRSNFTNTTSASISGLSGSTQYSFRVGVWNQGGGLTSFSNILNITTDIDPTGSFTPGTFNLTGSGTDVREIKYVRDDIDDTTLLLNVTADNDFELACNFHYKFANTNNTYTSIANTSINANEDMASFQFNNVNNEIIDVLCWDQYTNASARYVITITDFPLLDQIRDFRAGEFGTAGNFGALDLITLLVVIISFVGFNRVDETVGIIFGLFVVGGLAVLSVGEIITWETTYTAGFALLIMFGIAIVRKG